MDIKRTHDKLYLDAHYKEQPKEYFKLIEREARKDMSLTADSSIAWLDIGCETGSFLYYLRKNFSRMELTGMDVMKELLDHVNDGINGKKIAVFEGDISNSSKLPNKKFDAISMSGVIQIFDDYETVLSNTLALLKNNGILYLVSLFNPEPYDVFVKYRPSCVGGENKALEAGWNMISLESIRCFCREKGFTTDIIPFEIGIDIPRNENDTVRS